MGIILRQSFKGTIITYVGVFIAYLNLIFLLPYCLDVSQIGVVRLIIEASVFFSLFFQLGAPYILIRYKPLTERENVKGVLGLSSAYALVGMMLFVLFFSLFKQQIGEFYSERSKEFVDFIEYVLPLTLIIISVNLFERYSHSNKRIVIPNLLREGFIRASLGALVILYFFKVINFDQVLIGVIASYVLQFLVLLVYTNRLEKINLRPSKQLLSKQNLISVASYASFITIGAVGGGLVGKLDVIMIGSLAGLEEVGIYSTMFYIATIIEMPRRALMQISNPIISEHLANDEISKVESLYKKTSINQLIVGSGLFLLVWFNLDPLFDIMPKGEVFRAGKWVVLIIGVSKLYDLATGINNQILLNSKYYRFSLISIFLLSILAIATNWYMIPILGIKGAALATLVSIFLFNSVLLIFIYSKFRIHPFNQQSLKLLLLLIACFVMVGFIPSTSNAFIDITLRSVIIILAFGIPVYLLKLSNDLNDLALNILRRMKIIS